MSRSRISQEKQTALNSHRRSGKKHAAQTPPRSGAPLLLKRYVRWLFGKTGKQSRKSNLPADVTFKSPRKVVIATGSAATLALLAVVPSQVSSQSVGRDSCQEVVRSGAEISRGELASLASIPPGETNEAVRGLIDVPYCLLPVASGGTAEYAAAGDSERPVTVREAYPLAFDPEAWVVVNYSEDTYVGYDFAFKP